MLLNRPDYLPDHLRILHEGRTCTCLHNLRNRTAAVNIYDRWIVLKEIIHAPFDRIIGWSEYLDDESFLSRIPFKKRLCLLSIPGKTFSAYHLSNRRIRAFFPGYLSESLICISCKRGKYETPT